MEEQNLELNNQYYRTKCETLAKIGKYKEVLKYAEMGQNYYPKEFEYYSWIGISHYFLKNYPQSYKNLKKYLVSNPDSLNEIKYQNFIKIMVINTALRKAVKYYREFDFISTSEWLEIYIEEVHGTLAFKDLEEWEKIFIGLLRILNPQICLGDSNLYYKIFHELKLSYLNKISNNEQISKEEDGINKFRAYRENDIIGFGRHRGKTISDIIEFEPDYLIWCIVNLIHFSLRNEILLNHKLMSNPDYLKALEINIVKHQFHINTLPQDILDQLYGPEDEYFVDESENEDSYDYNTRPTYGKYSEYFVQSELGLSDNFIDDALGGEPDAYWNID